MNDNTRNNYARMLLITNTEEELNNNEKANFSVLEDKGMK